MPTLYGVSASPYVRKVRVFLAEKHVAYELEPVVPGRLPADYRNISPLGKIPAFSDGDFTISDSSVICAYLERVHPQPPLYPADAKEYARALWLEEYADTALGGTLTAKIFFQRIVRPMLVGESSDESVVEAAVRKEVPPLFDYLERQVRGRDFLAGNAFSIADISVATQFVSAAHARFTVDAAGWPSLAAYVHRILARASFKNCIEEERATLPPS
jgi:glutathione S-transferase